MKVLSILPLLVVLALPAYAEYHKNIVHVLEQLRDIEGIDGLPSVGGQAIGPGGVPHQFYLLFPYVTEEATDNDLLEMIKDPSPIVRIMGAKCILKAKYRNVSKSEVDILIADPEKVMVQAGGCEIEFLTVGDVIAELKNDPDYLGPILPPNQSVETTAPAAPPP